MMNTNQLMTVAAAGFALYALHYINKKPGQGAAAQPGQAARDIGLMDWNDLQTTQQNSFANGQIFSVTHSPLEGLLSFGAPT